MSPVLGVYKKTYKVRRPVSQRVPHEAGLHLRDQAAGHGRLRGKRLGRIVELELLRGDAPKHLAFRLVCVTLRWSTLNVL